MIKNLIFNPTNYYSGFLVIKSLVMKLTSKFVKMKKICDEFEETLIDLRYDAKSPRKQIMGGKLNSEGEVKTEKN
jgi:hypothetical protein